MVAAGAVAWLAPFLAAFAGHGRLALAEEAHELGDGVEIEASHGVALVYDDNALLGRRGQFLDSPSVTDGRRDSLLVRHSADATMRWRLPRLGERDAVSVASRFALGLLNTVAELRGYDVASTATFTKSFCRAGELSPRLAAAYHREDPEWSFRALRPGFRGAYVFEPGVLVTLDYDYTAQQFAATAAGAGQPKNSYANVDNQAHRLQGEARVWWASWLRASLAAELSAARYAGNLNENLEDYAGLERGTERADLGGGVALRALVRPALRLVVVAGVRYDENRSSSAPFRFHAGHLQLDALYQPWRDHTFLLRLDGATYDFFDERFDRRYLDTRRDYRLDAGLWYRYRLAPGVDLSLGYRRLQSDSNDCIAFDPRRDELGLPVFSRSYSCYSQDRLDIALRQSL